MGVWQTIASGESAGLQVAVLCEQSDPSHWQLNVQTATAQAWFDLPDHTAVHQLLRFIEHTHHKAFEIRPEMTVGTFCGRWVRFVRNDEDDRYYATLDPPQSAQGGFDDSIFLWLEPQQIDAIVECLRHLVRALDARGEPT